MKKKIWIACLAFVFSFTFQHSVAAASVKLSEAETIQKYHSSKQEKAVHVFKKGQSKKGWFSKLKAKFHQKFKKGKAKPSKEQAKKHLIICLGLIVLSIIFFALNRYGLLFNILGSVFAIGAAAFFVLWLLHFTNTI